MNEDRIRKTLSFDRRGKQTTVVSERAEIMPAPPLPSQEVLDWTQKELECARQFNFDLPEDLGLAVRLLENSVAMLTQTRKNAILLFDEESGTYACLNDQSDVLAKPRELTRISDHFLQELLQHEAVLHTYLIHKNRLIGILAVADKLDETSFTIHDEVNLDLVAKYLSTKVLSFQSMKQALSLPFIQQVILDLFSRLITAMDQKSILKEILEVLGNRLGFEVCQFVRLDKQTGEGIVLIDYHNGTLMHYFDHAPAEQKKVSEYASLVSLFTSIARRDPFLHITGGSLGDRSLASMFHVDGVGSALIIPVMEATTGKVNGTLNLFRQKSGNIPIEALEIAKEVSVIASLALSRAQALEKALAVASSDELTGLMNRRGFYERFESEIERGRRNPSSMCVAMIDVDYFKKLNDTYGHLTGDRVLQTLAVLFIKNVRKSDVICRFGGEEFAFLLPDTSLKSATELMERIRRKISKHRFQGAHGETVQTSISVGITDIDCAVHLAKTPQELISEALSKADELLYEAKEKGRNRISSSLYEFPEEIGENSN